MATIKSQMTLDDGISAMMKKVRSTVGKYANLTAVKDLTESALKAADTQIRAQTRLGTAVGTGDYYDQILEKAGEIQGKGVYSDETMIAGASELAAYFSDGEAVLSMMDTLTNYAAGMSALDGKGLKLDSDPMVQYAANLGKMTTGTYTDMSSKGFTFTDTQKAIIEGTATETQIVAELGEEYLGMSQDMQAAAAINAVIAERWGGLYEAMSNTPEGKIVQLNNTLGGIKENMGAGIYPAVLNFVNVIQSHFPQIETAAMGLVTVLGLMITLLTNIVEGVMAFGTAVADNWSWIEPIIWGVVAALIAYNATQGIAWLTTLKDIAVKGAHAIASAGETVAILALIAAQDGLNAAIAACPITWIVVAVIALIAVIFAVCSAIAKFTGVASSGFGVLCGAVNVAIQCVINFGLAIANFGLAVWNVICEVGQWFQNLGLGIWNVLCACANNVKAAFCNAWIWIQEKFWDLVSAVLSGILSIANKINSFVGIFGLEIDTSGIEAQIDSIAAKKESLENSKMEFKNIGEAWSEGWNTNEIDFGQAWSDGMSTFDAFSEGWASDAFQAGAAWGDGVADKVGGMIQGLGYEPGTIEDYTDTGPGSFAMDDLNDNVEDIADNTGGMAGTLEVSGEELKYLRDIAERDAIDRFTTAEVKIDMTGMTNKIDSGADLDGVIRELTDGFSEALVTAAEGVHE